MIIKRDKKMNDLEGTIEEWQANIQKVAEK